METEWRVQSRLAERLAALRAERGWNLDVLAGQTGLSRSTLSRIERGELSPTAMMLGRLAAAYGRTMSRLIAAAEAEPPNLVRAGEQGVWQDPESGYQRRSVSPPSAGLRGEVVEIRLPAGARVSFDASPVPDLEHHLWMLDGRMTLEVEGNRFDLEPGDCLRYVLNGSTRFACGPEPARYVIALVRP